MLKTKVKKTKSVIKNKSTHNNNIIEDQCMELRKYQKGLSKHLVERVKSTPYAIITPVNIPYTIHVKKSINDVINDLFVQHKRLSDEFDNIKEKIDHSKYEFPINKRREEDNNEMPSQTLNSSSIFVPIK